MQRRLASRDLEVVSFDLAVDEVTAAGDHHGVAMAALILPNSLSLGANTATGPVRGGLTRQASESAINRVEVKAPAAPALRPGGKSQNSRRYGFFL